MRVRILVTALCLGACGGEGFGDEAGEEESSVASALGTAPRTVAVLAAQQCSLIAGDFLHGRSIWPGTVGLNYIYATTPYAVLSCRLDQMVNPWDTAMLTRLTYNHPNGQTEPLFCRIDAMNGSSVVGSTAWMSSAPNSSSTMEWEHWYARDFNGWVRTPNPTQNSYRLFCRLPKGVQFFRYIYDYVDAI
jgi:hypothetical protein